MVGNGNGSWKVLRVNSNSSAPSWKLLLVAQCRRRSCAQVKFGERGVQRDGVIERAPVPTNSEADPQRKPFFFITPACAAAIVADQLLVISTTSLAVRPMSSAQYGFSSVAPPTGLELHALHVVGVVSGAVCQLSSK